MQDKSIIEIGRLKGNKTAKPYQNFIGNLFPGKNYNMVLAVINFTKSNKEYQFEFDKVDAELVSEKNYLQYAYRKGSARGGDITFTTKFNNIEKLFPTVQNQLKKLISFSEKGGYLDDIVFFKSFKNFLNKQTETIEADLLDKFGSSLGNPKIPLGFSFLFKSDVEVWYLEKFESIQKLLYQVGTAGKSEKYKVISEGYDELCSICMEKKSVLHGFASPFKYATVDKTGLVSGFFKQKNNWKNYPICSDCALDFELGQKYVTQNLNNYFHGKNYYIIPKVTVGDNPDLLNRALKTIERLEYREKEGAQIAAREDFLMEEIGEKEGDYNQYTLTLLFYEENPTTKAIKIKLLLEEIFPSRFKTLFVDVPKKVNVIPIFRDSLFINKEKKDLRFSFGILKQFFGDNFYEIIQKTFLGLPISEEFLYSKFMEKIRKVYINTGLDSIAIYSNSYYTYYLNSNTKGHTSLLKLALMVMSYFRLLKIIPSTQNFKNMEEQEENLLGLEKKKAFDEEKFKKFLSDNTGFLNSPEKIGVFSVGIYVRFLIDIQNAELKNTPFEKKLRGYNLNPLILENIYVEAYKKINQYKKFYTYSNLREIIKEYFILNRHKLKQISNSELSFYFVAGLEFGNQFKTKKSNDNE